MTFLRAKLEKYSSSYFEFTESLSWNKDFSANTDLSEVRNTVKGKGMWHMGQKAARKKCIIRPGARELKKV